MFGSDEGTLESCERLSDGSLDCGTNMSCAPGLVSGFLFSKLYISIPLNYVVHDVGFTSF